MHWPCFAKLIAWEHVLVRIVKIIYWTFVGLILTTCVLTSTMLWYEQWLSSYSYTSTGRTLLWVWDFYRTGVLDWWVVYIPYMLWLYEFIIHFSSLSHFSEPGQPACSSHLHHLWISPAKVWSSQTPDVQLYSLHSRMVCSCYG